MARPHPPPIDDDVVLYSDLTREIRSTKRFVSKQLRAFRVEILAHLPNGELEDLRTILPELKTIAKERRRADQGHAWMASLLPAWSRDWAGKLAYAVIATVVLVALEHWLFGVPVRLPHPG